MGTPDGPTEFGMASTIGLNGYIVAMEYSEDSTTSYGDDPIGVFKGSCTVTSQKTGELLCKYEIAINGSSEDALYPVGVLIVSGPVTGGEHRGVVTGTSLNFEMYSGGHFRTIQDPTDPVLYASMSLR